MQYMQPVSDTQLLQSVAAEHEVTQVSREENVWSDLQLLPAVSGRMHWLVELHFVEQELQLGVE